MKKEIYVRNLEKRDLPAIVSLEERQTGIARPAYRDKRIEISEPMRPPLRLFHRRDRQSRRRLVGARR
jgi:hypothetical protein